MNPPQIVLLSSPQGHFSPIASGAIATWLYHVARAAQDEGFSPLVVARRAAQPPYEGIAARFVDYPRAPASPLQMRWARARRKLTGWPQFGHALYAARVARLLKSESLSHLPLVVNNDPELAVFLRARFPDARIIHHFHNQMTMRPRWKARLGGARLEITAVSDFTRRWLASEYDLALDSMHTVFNGVDLQLFHPADPMPPGPPVLNFVGRTGIEKGADLLLEAALILRAETPKLDFAVQIVGANNWTGWHLDSYQKVLLEKVAALEKRGVSVRQTGHVNRSEVPDQFRRAHIHVVPSRWDEPFGLTTVEGMASGLATVASNTGGSPEIIADAGFLFERDNAQDLADKLRPLVADSELRRDYAHKARRRALDFPWKNTWNGLKNAARL